MSIAGQMMVLVGLSFGLGMPFLGWLMEGRLRREDQGFHIRVGVIGAILVLVGIYLQMR